MSKCSSLKNKIKIPQAYTSRLFCDVLRIYLQISRGSIVLIQFCFRDEYYIFLFFLFSPGCKASSHPTKAKYEFTDWQICVFVWFPSRSLLMLPLFVVRPWGHSTANGSSSLRGTSQIVSRAWRNVIRLGSRPVNLWHMQEWPLIWFVCLCNLFKTNLWSLSFEQLPGKLIKREEHMWNWIHYVKQANGVSGSSLGQGLLYIPESCQWRPMCSCLLTFYILLLIWNTCSGGGSQLQASHYFTSFVMKLISPPP